MTNSLDEILAKYAPENETGSSAWMLTLADLLSLILVFFILMYAVSTIRQEQGKEMMDSLNKAFKGVQIIPSDSYTTPLGVQPIRQVQGMDLHYVNAILQNKADAKDPLLDTIKYNYIPLDKLTISIPNSYLFIGESRELTDEARISLFDLAELIQRLNNRIEVTVYLNGKLSGVGDVEWNRALARAVIVTAEMKRFADTANLHAFIKTAPEETAPTLAARDRVDIVIWQ